MLKSLHSYWPSAILTELGISKESQKKSVFMFVFATFFKPLEEIAHSLAFTMSFPVASIYIAYKMGQTRPTPKPFSIFHPPFNVQHFNFKP